MNNEALIKKLKSMARDHIRNGVCTFNLSQFLDSIDHEIGDLCTFTKKGMERIYLDEFDLVIKLLKKDVK